MSARYLKIPTVTCDDCETYEEGAAGESITDLRERLRDEGWRLRRRRDLCGECVPRYYVAP